MTAEDFFKICNNYTREEYFSKFGEIEQVLRGFEAQLVGQNQQERDSVLCDIWELVEGAHGWMRIHMRSFCLKVGKKAEYAEHLLKEVTEADVNEVGEYEKLSHYWQISCVIFQNRNLENPTVEKRLMELYRSLFQSFCEALGVSGRNYIPMEQRDKRLVIVFTSQVLGMKHAPTKTLLDRCYVLQKNFGKKVWIINTAMQIPEKGQAPFYGLVCGQYRENLLKQDHLTFRDEKFAFYQCGNTMPDLEEIALVIRMVKRMKPYYLINIGGSDICTDLCGLFVPEITVSTVFSKIGVSCGEFQIVDKMLTAEDERQLRILKVEPQKVRRARFTFLFKEQTHIYTRADFGIWEDKFILVVIGWRLDEEIDRNFLEFLEHLLQKEPRIGIVFMGKFHHYVDYVKQGPFIEKYSKNLGEQEDVLAALECCDLYVNPNRNGGGSSASEALYKGLPVVTLPAGDVSVAAGEQFWVCDYDEMEMQVLRYVHDEAYYHEMSELAKERASVLMDSGNSFGRVIQEIEKEIETV